MSEQFDFFVRLLCLVPSADRPPDPAPPPALRRVTRDDAELTARCVELLRNLGCDALAQKVRVCWSGRLQSTAGLAFPTKGVIKLNPRLREFGESEIQQTLLHELAHLLAHYRAGRRRISPHGPEWRQACQDLGLPNEKRCHDFPLPRRQMPRAHLYQCPACKVEMRRVRPLRRPSACLKCCRKHSGGRYDERFRFVRRHERPS